MAKKKGIRRHIILKSTESGHAYHSEKAAEILQIELKLKSLTLS